ncbi:MAG: amidohydrolase family protein [Actinomycetota bacterium]
MESTLVISGGTALLGPELRPEDDAAIVVSGDRIEAVGAPGEIDVPAGTERVNTSGLLVLPGFIDAHVHIGFYEPREVLLGGVTTVRDLAWPPDEIHELARRSRDDDFCGPTVLAAGPMLTVAGGYPTRAPWAPDGTGRVVDDPDDANAVVARTVEEGASVIKVALNPSVGPTLDIDTLHAIVEAAHARGLKVTGHVHGLEELDKAIEAGVDELAHILMSPEPIPEATIERMVAADMTVVPTTAIFFGRERDIAIENVGAFVEAGGAVVYGTDLGNEGPRPGIDRREIEGMRAAGMEARDIVAAATVGAAHRLATPGVGAIAPDYVADIIAVPEDALGDASLLSDVRIVIRHGRRY